MSARSRGNARLPTVAAAGVCVTSAPRPSPPLASFETQNARFNFTEVRTLHAAGMRHRRVPVQPQHLGLQRTAPDVGSSSAGNLAPAQNAAPWSLASRQQQQLQSARFQSTTVCHSSRRAECSTERALTPLGEHERWEAATCCRRSGSAALAAACSTQRPHAVAACVAAVTTALQCQQPRPDAEKAVSKDAHPLSISAAPRSTPPPPPRRCAGCAGARRW
jgi:hypothetical protein